MPLSFTNLAIWSGFFVVPLVTGAFSLCTISTVQNKDPRVMPSLPTQSSNYTFFSACICWIGLFCYPTTAMLKFACALSFATPWACYLFLPDDKKPSNPTPMRSNTNDHTQAATQVAAWSIESWLRWASNITAVAAIASVIFGYTYTAVQKQEEEKKKKQGEDRTDNQPPQNPDDSERRI